MKVENFEAAVHFYGKAIELNPANAVYFCNRYLPGLLRGPASQSHILAGRTGCCTVGYRLPPLQSQIHIVSAGQRAVRVDSDI